MNLFKINIGDVINITDDKLVLPKVGDDYTIYPDGLLYPIITTCYTKIKGKFQLIRIHKTTKKWYQFWKRRKIISADFKCIEI